MSDNIKYRNELGRPLTWEELDNNFRYEEKWTANYPYLKDMVVSYVYLQFQHLL